MRRLILTPLLVFAMFALACGDSMLLQPEDHAGLQIVANSVPKMIPLKGQGTWETEFNLVPAGPGCQAAGGTHEYYLDGSMNLTHLGLSANLIFQCFAFTASGAVVKFTTETLTAANGDQLVIYEPGTPLTQVPAGWDIGYPFEVMNGSGRFEGATGEGVVYLTVEFTATGFHGSEYIDGIISAVGSN